MIVPKNTHLEKLSEPDFIQWLRDNRACQDGVEWAVKNKIKSAQEAWDKLQCADWMFWLAEARKSHLMKDDKNLRLFAADCAEAVLPIYEKQYPDDKRPRLAVQAARDFANGKISAEQLDAAGDAAWDAAGDAQAKNLRKYFKKLQG